MNALTLLARGRVTVCGSFLFGSNATWLAEVRLAGERLLAVYKPVAGERPLYDFPRGTLAHREVAAFHLAQALWNMVPPTVFREDLPLGPGALQQFIPHDPQVHYFTLTDAERQCLRPVALFDLVANNADRKGGHILRDPQGRFWLIDHGLCFHVEDKLRTVIWDFVGEPIPDPLVQDLARLEGQLIPQAPLYRTLRQHLTPEEIAATRRRVTALLANPVFPHPPRHRRAVPWPLV